MKWSFSGYRQFRRCQRQWYFDTVVGHHAAKDAFRREVYLLSKLQDLAAWRGQLVDHVLSTAVMRDIQRRRLPLYDRVLSTARDIFDRQVAFARAHRLRDPNMTPSTHKEAFTAWRMIEYGDSIDDNALEGYWNDIVTCLKHFYAMTDVHSLLLNATRCLV